MCFFQAEDGIRDLVRSRGLGDVYKRQVLHRAESHALFWLTLFSLPFAWLVARVQRDAVQLLSLIHI